MVTTNPAPFALSPDSLYGNVVIDGVTIRAIPYSVRESEGRPYRGYEFRFWLDNPPWGKPKRPVKLLYPGHHTWHFSHFEDNDETCVTLWGAEFRDDTWARLPTMREAIAFIRNFYQERSDVERA